MLFKELLVPMFHPRIIVKAISTVLSNGSHKSISTNSIRTDRILVVAKLSRYEYEKRKYKNLTNNDLLKFLKIRGTDLENLIHHHDLQKHFEENVINTLKNMGIEVEIVNRHNFREENVENADIVMPCGGDGTFLLAASMVHGNRKPVIGFNSNPARSEGYLCLPKKYSTNIREAVERIQTGKYKWLMRNRIRITLMISEKENFIPSYLHDLDGDPLPRKMVQNSQAEKILPYLALNEVFIGETLSARVSHLQMRLNGSTESTNVKCSGICISTGTGSTSWHLSINRMPVQNVAELLRLLDLDPTKGKDGLANVLSDIYNKNLIFAPDDKRMAYTIRELISAGVWPDPKGIKPRSFASKIELKSNCFDASLVIDGGVSFKFNDGTTALLEIKPEDALRTIIF
ncbi:NAD kinase 2, mitochondrial isoform X2 [Cylas formicarius]|uniref:NAD kinase 2, mitochondrial isoform X2 n=1 Tax=Cylas formicarius TaxID=197179 RepID=UPI002958524A|nr:NAD kinase 2, mitochondrial isoform X2 [Cylas formicarius]